MLYFHGCGHDQSRATWQSGFVVFMQRYERALPVLPPWCKYSKKCVSLLTQLLGGMILLTIMREGNEKTHFNRCRLAAKTLC